MLHLIKPSPYKSGQLPCNNWHVSYSVNAISKNKKKKKKKKKKKEKKKKKKEKKKRKKKKKKKKHKFNWDVSHDQVKQL